MQIIPWRVKSFISEYFPLAYHLITNRGRNGNSEEYWNTRLAETWDAPNRNWPVKADVIAQTLKYGMSIIDVGCGTGSILRSLQQCGFTNVHGVEFSEYAVRRLSVEGIAVSKGNLLNLPFPTAKFDAAIASEVLEHIIFRKRFLNELTRIVKPSGKILIFVPDDSLGPIDEPEHVIKYDAKSLKSFLSEFVTVEAITSTVEPRNGVRSLFADCSNAVAGRRPPKNRRIRICPLV
jgi:2-polyprenyl-3-methyl-5-hydroxy-6-metoxy-1,4-benzoquinol methylase